MYRFRKCDKLSDATLLHNLIRELAMYEKCEHKVELSVDDLRRDGFETHPPLFNAVIAEYCDDDCVNGKPDEKKEEAWEAVGHAIWFYSYSSWKGRTFYLEDFYVRPEHRQKGVGKRLYSVCVKQAYDSKCQAFDFVVLKWNENALQVYKSFGVMPRDNDGWYMMRMEADDIAKFMSTRYAE